MGRRLGEMNRPRAILVLILSIFAVTLFLGCDNETTSPKRTEQSHVDPIDWDGDKENWVGGGPGQAVSDAPSPASVGTDLDAREHVLGSDLRPHDHTIIMEAIIGNVREIAARLPQNQVSSGMEVLQAALTVPAIDRYTKSRIHLVVDELARLEQTRDQIPDETQQAMSDLLERLDAYPTITDKTEALQHMIDSGQYDAYEGLPQGMATGIKILRDGEKTIYSPRCLLNLKRLLQHDVEGAIAGAIGGLIVAGPPGAGLGAVAGAAGASGSDLVGQLTGWW
jgi:hypothetical protein